MCNVHIENGSNYDETNTLTAGDDITTFYIGDIKCGVAICYDADFDEFIKIYRKVGSSKSLGCQKFDSPIKPQNNKLFLFSLKIVGP